MGAKVEPGDLVMTNFQDTFLFAETTGFNIVAVVRPGSLVLVLAYCDFQVLVMTSEGSLGWCQVGSVTQIQDDPCG